MKIHRACWVLAAALLSAGCVSQGSGVTEALPNIAMVGSAGDSYTKNLPTRRPVSIPDIVETRGVMAFDVHKTDTFPFPNQDYRVIFGTSKGDTQSAKGHFFQRDHPLHLLRSMAWFHLSGNCWVYVYGEGPMLETDIVEAGSDGSDSDLLVQIVKVNNEIVHRVYFLEVGSSAWVRNRKPPHGQFPPHPPTNLQFVPGHFVEARNDGTVTNPKPIPDPANNPNHPIVLFLDYVNGQKKPFKK